MIVVALGVMWMHSSAHDAHVCDSHLSDSHVVEAVASEMMPTVDGSAVTFEDGAAADVAQLCVALMTAMCLAVLTFALWRLRNPAVVLRRAAQLRNVVRPWAEALPSDRRWSFMELSVWRI
jgi:hypothetical protein